MPKDPKLQAIKVAMEQIEKQYGAGSIMRLGEQQHTDIAFIPTGSPALDIALGIGGLPRGRITEIFGPEASGKTTLCLHVIAEAQKKGGQCAFVDAEHALDPEYAKKIGVQIGDLLISQPDNGEQALEIVEKYPPEGIHIVYYIARYLVVYCLYCGNLLVKSIVYDVWRQKDVPYNKRKGDAEKKEHEEDYCLIMLFDKLPLLKY